MVESLDERAQGGIAEWVAGLIKRGVFRRTDYLRNLSNVVLTLARHGRGVIVGRDPNHYDLIVNTGTLGVEGAAARVVDAFRLRFGAAT